MVDDFGGQGLALGFGNENLDIRGAVVFLDFAEDVVELG